VTAATLMGLDVGTTGVKAVLFDADGTLLASASREVAVDLPHPGWAEQDAESVWGLAVDAMAEAIASAAVTDVAAIGLSVHGEAVTPLDAAGRPLRPCILGMDTRTEAQNAWLRERFGSVALFERTGMPIHTINTLPKLLWIREQEPDVWRGAARFVLIEDFFIGRLTGHWVMSECLASRTQLCDLASGAWDPGILAAVGVDPARLSRIVPSGSAVGEVSADVVSRLGLRRPPTVVTGGHDQACGALGVGLTVPGLASVSTGTAEVVEVALAGPIVARPLFEGNISVYRHVIPGRFLAMTLNHSGGLALRWFRDGFCEADVERAARHGADAYDLMLADAPSGPTDLLVLPHFAGAGTPTFDTASRGAIVGLTFASTRAEIALAILEGLTYELCLNLELLRSGGVQIDVLRAIGGGARSRRWLQLKADATGIPVVTPRVTEAAALGAALLAGAGAGIYATAADAAERCLVLSDTYEPDSRRHQAYRQRFELYRELYPAIAPIAHGLA
jgi:xylulokinase